MRKYRLQDLCKVDGIPRSLNEELMSYIVTYKEGDGKDQTATVSGTSESDARGRFMDSKEGRKIQVRSVIVNSEGQLDEDGSGSTTSSLDGGAGQPLVPHAFSKKVRKPADTVYSNNMTADGTDVLMSKGKMFITVEFITPRAKNVASGQFYNKYPKVNQIDGPHMYKLRPEAVTRLQEFLDRNHLTYQVNESYKPTDSKRTVTEVSYKEWVSDSTTSNRKKVNKAIHEVSKNLYTIEQMVSRSAKLKTEMGADYNVFWKSTQEKFAKINERLLRLSRTVMELNK